MGEFIITLSWAVVLAIVTIWIAPDVHDAIVARKIRRSRPAKKAEARGLSSICETPLNVRHMVTEDCRMIWGQCDVGKIQLAVRCNQVEAEKRLTEYREQYPEYRFWIAPIMEA